MTTALAQIEDEGRALVARAAASLPAKVLARRTGLTERHICGLRKGEHMPGGVALIAPQLEASLLAAARRMAEIKGGNA